MSEGLAIAIVAALGTILTPVLVALIGKWKPGTTAAVQVTSVPSTRTVDALAAALAELTARVGVLETREQAYIARIAYLEVWGSHATDPPPRAVPPWIDRPQ